MISIESIGEKYSIVCVPGVRSILSEMISSLLVSSVAEGYSLPIVESQNFGMPVFARDIPVFREIGYIHKNITFFKGGEPEDIARQFLKWKSSLNGRKHGEKNDSKTICWKKATKDLQKIIID